MKPIKTAADYAAIAVAPILIFLMISSLANFFTLTLYRGGFTGRLSWILLMFTMGTVGIARVAIERDRAYSLGYAGVLGLVTFVTMIRFVDSPIFAILILGLIAYLSDVIVRDCTLIDDEVDASGEGLIDSGRLYVKDQMEAHKNMEGQRDTAEDEAVEAGGSESGDNRVDDSAKKRKPKKTHQPGRTVLYLALAALPLFGLGQFFLRNDTATWDRAQRLLAFYLFASLSLLVTTSFLGLRRYLRQRRVDMPADVSIAWLGGGVAMIATVLLIAYMAPMPGRALATFQLPYQLDSPGGTQASRFGWGDEGADQSNPDAPKTIDPEQGKQEDGQVAQKGAPAGDVSEGGRDQGPAGNQSGGKQSGGSPSKDSSKSQSKSAPSKSQSSQSSSSPSQQNKSEQSQSSSKQSQSKNSASGDQKSQKSQSQQSQSQSQSQQSQSQQSGAKSESSQQNESRKGESGQDKQSSEQGKRSEQSKSDSESDSKRDGSEQKSDSPESDSPESDSSQEGSKQERESDNQNDQQSESSQQSSKASESDSSNEQSSSKSAGQSIASGLNFVAGLIKFLVFAALAGIVIAFVWIHREMIREWWESLFGLQRPSEVPVQDELLELITKVPPREFASFRNPIGKEKDSRRAMVITFQAFEAWSREHGAARERDETPTEFLRRATKVAPQVSKQATQIVDSYNRIVYGRGRPSDQDMKAAAEVWRWMQQPAAIEQAAKT